jgi:flavin reductase (DIM6/NTAB) family NADH-FMN oxidoreductase RutF
MNQASAEVPIEESEWGIAAFNQVTSLVIRPARIAESPAQLECRLYKIVEHGDGPGSANYVIGEVVQIHLREDLVGLPESIRPVGRLGGQLYIDTASGELFALARPSGSPNRQ